MGAMVERRHTMRLTWKDAIATGLIGLAAGVAWAEVESWGWPLVGSPRAAIIVLGLLGLTVCAVAGAGTGAAAKEPPTFHGVLGAVAAVLHGAAAVIIVVGLVAPSTTMVLALAVDVVVLWMVGTAHHALTEDSTEAVRPLGHAA
jgi:hypothetical protein